MKELLDIIFPTLSDELIIVISPVSYTHLEEKLVGP